MSQHPYRLMAPGPVPLPEEVRSAMAEPMIHHRTPLFADILKRVFKKLKCAFQTKQPVLMLTSTGSGGLEAAVVNTLSRKDKVLCIRSGKFGERWGQICEAHGANVHWIDVTWGESVSTTTVEKFLNENPDTKAVLTQVCETSTGALHPVQKLGEMIHKLPNTLFMVDAITAIGCLPLPMDDYHLDVVVAGAQKAFMIPTGLAFISLSEKAWLAQANSNLPKFYFDLSLEKRAYEKGQTLFSSAVTHVLGLDKSLEYFSEENRISTQNRIQALANSCSSAIKEWGWEIFPAQPSPSLTVIKVPEGIDGQVWRKKIEQDFNITIMGGQDHLQGKILRIGHMGAIENSDLLATLEAIASTYNELSPTPLAEETIKRGLNSAEAILNQT